MIKIAIIILICLIICLIGFKLSNQYIEKYKFFNQLCLLLEELKLNITFKKEKVENVLLRFEKNKELKEFISAFSTYLAENKLDLSNVKQIETQDVETLENIIKNMGHYEYNTELEQLNSFIERIKIKTTEAENDKKKFSGMIFKLSILSSIAVAIVLI